MKNEISRILKDAEHCVTADGVCLLVIQMARVIRGAGAAVSVTSVSFPNEPPTFEVNAYCAGDEWHSHGTGDMRDGFLSILKQMAKQHEKAT